MNKVKGLALCLAMIWGVVGLAAQIPEWQWAVKAGGSGQDSSQGIAIDSLGNQYVTGTFEGSIAFGSYTLTSSGYYDIFAAKLDPNGNFLWAVRAGGTSNDFGYGIAVDGSGSVLLTGSFLDTATFGSYTLISDGNRDIFTAKLDINGNFLWAVRAGGTSYDYCSGIAVDVVGNAYLTGYFWGNSSFGSYTLISSGDVDIFAAKLDPNGNWLWAIRAGGTSYEFGYGIAVDGAGKAYLTGCFMGSAAFGPYTLICGGSDDIFVAKLSGPLNAYFSADLTSDPEPLTVQFTDQSTPGGYPIINWFWTFGDGETSTVQNPVHTYLNPGVYTVTLTVMDQNYQTSTKVRPDYITVIERVYAIELVSAPHLNFGNIWLEEQSAWQPVTLSNTGNVDLTLSAAYFANMSANFELSEPFSEMVLPPGAVDSLRVRFAPQQVGAVSDTLVIVNNSANQPLVKIRLTGTGEYVPLAVPQNMVIIMAGNDVHLAWDAVTMNLHDQPVTPDYYLVFSSADPYATFVYHGATPGLQYRFPMAGFLQPRMFYRVVAYKYYGRGVFDPEAWGLVPGLREEEVFRLLPY